MNQTEILADAWLKRQGYHDVIFQRRATPDFLTPKGNFEAKRVYGNVIYFSKGQMEKVIKANATVLAFEDENPKPVLVIKSTDLTKPTIKGYIIKQASSTTGTSTFMQTIDDSVYDDLASIAKSKGIGIQELVRSIIIPDFIQQNKLEELAQAQVPQVA